MLRERSGGKEIDPNKKWNQVSLQITWREQIEGETYFEEGKTKWLYFCGYEHANRVYAMLFNLPVLPVKQMDEEA